MIPKTLTSPLSIALALGLSLGFAMGAVPAHADPLRQPAIPSALATQRLITAVSPAGQGRWVAVGQRGHILVSGDGERWQQSASPVSSDLTSVQFLDERTGYVTGHDGVVLGSSDGGVSWTLLLDGRKANALALAQMEKEPPGPERERLLEELRRNQEAGPDKPFLDLHFTSATDGFVVGAYNLIFQTRDGGKTWSSWFARSDNRQGLLNIYSLRPHQGQLYAAGEGGLLMRLDTARQRFVRLEAGYKGSFFGLLDTGDALMAYGMRGNAFITRDGGRRWSPLATGLPASITAGARADDGSLWLADQVGNLRVSRDSGRSFKAVQQAQALPLAALGINPTSLILAGPRGLRALPLPKD